MDQLTRLALKAQAGDPQSVAALVEAGYQDVWRFCASLVDARVAEDLCQETFTRAIKALPTFRRESSARTWLLAIARYACTDELRKRARRRGHRATQQDAEVAAGDHSADISLADLVRQLEPGRQAAFVLTQVVGLSYCEAAEVCKCPVGTVRSRVARAREELVGLLQETGQYQARTGSA